MTSAVGVSGAYKNLQRASVGVGGAWKQITGAWVGVGGVWKRIVLLEVQLGASILCFRQGSSPANFNMNNDGSYSGNSTPPISGTWMVSGSASDYEVMYHPTSGSAGGAATDTWLSLGTTRTWSRGAGTGSDQTVVGTLSIRRASDSTVLATSTLTIECDNTV